MGRDDKDDSRPNRQLHKESLEFNDEEESDIIHENIIG